jgi:16S rRNA (guanine527-N7)-methyltransferase
VRPQIAHAEGFGVVLGPDAPHDRAVDLGSGAGLPGLVLAFTWPDSRWSLIEAGRRRAEFLVEATERLGCSERVQVLRERAEVVGRDPAHRGRYVLAVARGFGSPGVTAECASPLLFVGGTLVVSEPPPEHRAEASAERWPQGPLAELGLVPVHTPQKPGGTYQVLRQEWPCPDRYPRRVGIPAKRPLF